MSDVALTLGNGRTCAVTQTGDSFNLADVPPVSVSSIARVFRHLIETGQGLALFKGLDEAQWQALEGWLWQHFAATPETALAIALRMRALVGVFAARRLKDLQLHRGFPLIAEAAAVAANERLNIRFGFSAQRFVMRLSEVTPHGSPRTNTPDVIGNSAIAA